MACCIHLLFISDEFNQFHLVTFTITLQCHPVQWMVSIENGKFPFCHRANDKHENVRGEMLKRRQSKHRVCTIALNTVLFIIYLLFRCIRKSGYGTLGMGTSRAASTEWKLIRGFSDIVCLPACTSKPSQCTGAGDFCESLQFVMQSWLFVLSGIPIPRQIE